MQHGHLEQRHVQRDRQKAEQGKVAPVGAGEANGVPPQAAQGEGQQKERADEHALDRDLHGREDAVNGFEHDLHRAENDGAENDVQIAGIGALHRFPSFQNTVAQV